MSRSLTCGVARNLLMDLGDREFLGQRWLRGEGFRGCISRLWQHHRLGAWPTAAGAAKRSAVVRRGFDRGATTPRAVSHHLREASANVQLTVTALRAR